MLQLVKVVHGSKDCLDRLVETFHGQHIEIPKTHIRKKIHEIAIKTKHPDGYGAPRFVVQERELLRLKANFACQTNEDNSLAETKNEYLTGSSEVVLGANSVEWDQVASQHTVYSILMTFIQLTDTKDFIYT